MSKEIRVGDTVRLDNTLLSVMRAPEGFWVKCKVIQDQFGEYEVGFIGDFNIDFLYIE